MAVFEYLRLSLGKPEQGNLLAEIEAINSEIGTPYKKLTRREFLEKIFAGDRIDFYHRRQTYIFLKEGRTSDAIYGRIGKKKVERINLGPDERYLPTLQENWQTAWVIFDLRGDSQLIIVQRNIGSPKPLIRSLFDSIEKSGQFYEYEFFVEYVSEVNEFWAAVSANQGRISRLEFTFIPPNALGLHESIKEIVDKARDQLNADETKFVHTSAEGALHPSGEYVEAALEKTTEGAGSVLMKAGKTIIYSSSKNRKTVEIANEEVPEPNDDQKAVQLASKMMERR